MIITLIATILGVLFFGLNPLKIWLFVGAAQGAFSGFTLIMFSSARNEHGHPVESGENLILLAAVIVFLVSIALGPMAFVIRQIDAKYEVTSG